MLLRVQLIDCVFGHCWLAVLFTARCPAIHSSHRISRIKKKSLLLFLVRPFSSPKTLLGPLTVNCSLRCFSDFCSSVARLFSFKVIVGRRLFLLLQYSPGHRVVSRHRVSYLKSFIAQGVAPSLSHYREMCAGQLISSLSSALLACRTMTSIPVGFFLVLA